MRKAALLAVPHDWAGCVQPLVEPLAGKAFSRIVHGNRPEDFATLREGSDPLVVLIGGAGSNEVLRDVLEWRDEAGKKRVRWVHSYWTGVDAFGVTGLKTQFADVPLTNARGTFAPMLAEHVVLATLYFNRQVWRLQDQRKNRIWNRYPKIPGDTQTLGIIGYGSIGCAVAKAAAGGLGMKIKGLKSGSTAPEGFSQGSVDAHGVAVYRGEEGLNEILATSDVVAAVLPLVESTRHMLRREHFQRMKPDAIFVNIGRGATIVEEDLIAAIRAKEIKGAALDVFEKEPLPADSPLWELNDSQLLLSPHNADISTGSYVAAVTEFVASAETYAENGTLPEYKVDVTKGY